jgi:broad specificity phosphatase PhoE
MLLSWLGLTSEVKVFKGILKDMNVPLRIVLVRHGESERNALKGDQIFYPPTKAGEQLSAVPSENMPLSKHGWEQARATGKALRARYGAFDHIYHSGMHRVHETTEGILESYTDEERIQMPLSHNLRIRERDPGYTYGMTAEEANAAFPWLQHHFAVVGKFFGRPPGGESVADVTLRVGPFFKKINAENAGESLLIVTHGGVISSFRYYIEGWNYQQARELVGETSSACCGVTVFKYDEAKDGLALREHNSILY